MKPLLESASALFGFQINRVDDNEKNDDRLTAFTNENKNDGAVVVNAGGPMATYVDLDGSAKTEAELVTRYREMTLNSEIFSAVDDITNECIVVKDGESTVKIVLDDLPLDDKSKKLIEAEFQEVVRILEFNKKAYDIFRRWYVDGRLYYNVVVDKKQPNLGIQEMRYIDPRKIRKIREVAKKKANAQIDKQGVDLSRTVNEYYVFNEKGLATAKQPSGSATFASNGLKISKDAIVQVNSGITDENATMVLGYLHQAIKPLNQLRSLEDATLIYRISRAPERRIFYIDVSNLPRAKAEQQVRDLMVRHKNRIVYDSSTGEIRDDRKFTTMLEDYWLPRRDGGKGTEITTLPAGQNLGELADVLYFQKKLYKSLLVPYSRIEGDQGMFSNRSGEITRDEIKFSKFVDRIRHSFSDLFLLTLEKQLILKGLMSPDEWKQFAYLIRFRYLEDNYIAENKDTEIASGRLNTLTLWGPYVGRYVSNKYIQNNVLKMTDEEIETEKQQIMLEMSDPILFPPMAESEEQQPT
jgi:hypothetical protein